MSPTVNRRAVLIVLLVLAVVPYFVGLGDSAIWDANEAFYVETPRAMLERGDLINPSFNDQPRFNKPPLSYWIVAGFYRAFGESVAVERLAITFGAMLLIAAAFGVGRAAFSTEAGLIAALAVAASPRVVMLARRIFIDVYITMFMGLTLLFFVLAEREPERRRRYLVLMYIAMGLGFMTKGPIAIVLPGLILFAYLALHGRLRDLGRLMLPTGALIVAIVVLPWYLAIYTEHGWLYIRRFFFEENLSRYTAPYGANVDERGPLFYVPVLLTDLFPWSLFGVAALGLFGWRAWRARREAADDLAAGRRLPALLVLWVAVIVLFFSVSQSKQDLYIFPTVTALAALAGGLIACGLSAEDERANRLAGRISAAVGCLLAIAGVGVLYLFSSAARVYAIDGATVTGWIAVSAGLVAATLALGRRVFPAIVTLAIAPIAINGIFVLHALPSFTKYQPVPAMADRLRSLAGADARVGYYKMGLPSLVYYVRRPVFETFHPDQAVEVFASGATYCLMRASDYESLKDILPTLTCIVARAPIFDVKVGNVLARKPLPELLLVTNRCEP